MAAKEKVRFGFSECALAFFTDDSTDEAPEWDTPVKVPGGVSLTMSPENSEVDFYADNIVYYKARQTTSVSGELEMALVPDDITAKMLGWMIDKNGVLVELAKGDAKSFALLYQIENDKKGRRNAYYNCSAGAPSVEHTTNNEGLEVKTMKFPITAIPIKLGGEHVIKSGVAHSPESKTVYNNWYKSVYVPDLTEAGGEDEDDDGEDG